MCIWAAPSFAASQPVDQAATKGWLCWAPSAANTPMPGGLQTRTDQVWVVRETSSLSFLHNPQQQWAQDTDEAW